MNTFIILFLVCVVALAWRWHYQRPLQRVEPDPLPSPPDTLDGEPVLDRMKARNTEQAFLRQLIAYDASEEGRRLHDALAQTERDERSIFRVMLLVVVIFMSSMAGLGYCAILRPEVFRDPGHLVMRILGYSGLGSLVSQGGIFGYLLWHRVSVSRLRKKCRRQVLALAGSQLKVPAAPGLSIHGDPPAPGGSSRSSSQSTEMTPHESPSQETLRSYS